MPKLFTAALLLLTALPAVATPPSAGYTVTDLGELNTSASVGAVAVNDTGQAILDGMLTPGPENPNASLWERGQLMDIGTFPPNGGEDGTESEAYGLNNRGQIVGSAGSFGLIFMSGLVRSRGFLYQDATLFQITNYDESFQPFAINDQGQIVGQNAYRGFFYERGKLTEIDTLSRVPVGNRGVAHALNARGQVTGWSTVGKSKVISYAPLPFHAFLWDVKTRKLRDLGTLPGHRNSYAYSINNAGQVVGIANDDLYGDAVTTKKAIGVLWSGKTKMALPPLPGDVGSAAWGINNAGVIVGQSVDAKGTVRACLWHGKEPVDLNTYLPAGSGWTLTRASALNNKGWIVGNGMLGGKPHAFLLRPQEKRAFCTRIRGGS